MRPEPKKGAAYSTVHAPQSTHSTVHTPQKHTPIWSELQQVPHPLGKQSTEFGDNFEAPYPLPVHVDLSELPDDREGTHPETAERRDPSQRLLDKWLLFFVLQIYQPIWSEVPGLVLPFIGKFNKLKIYLTRCEYQLKIDLGWVTVTSKIYTVRVKTLVLQVNPSLVCSNTDEPWIMDLWILVIVVTLWSNNMVGDPQSSSCTKLLTPKHH